MFPNLEAMQVKHEHTNAYVAKLMGLSLQAFESKKKAGTFRLTEIQFLLVLYGVSFDYLFQIME